MRKIESDMITVIKNQRDAVALREESRISNTLGNTQVTTGLREDGKIVTSVYLYGYLIAQGDAFTWSFKMCGFPTRTTKSRINALAFAFGRDGVKTKAGKHYSGKTEVNDYDWF